MADDDAPVFVPELGEHIEVLGLKNEGFGEWMTMQRADDATGRVSKAYPPALLPGTARLTRGNAAVLL